MLSKGILPGKQPWGGVKVQVGTKSPSLKTQARHHQDDIFLHVLGEFGNPKLKKNNICHCHCRWGFWGVGSQEIQTPENHPRTGPVSTILLPIEGFDNFSGVNSLLNFMGVS